jgi:tetratricopeptide (TPR) repeat protein
MRPGLLLFWLIGLWGWAGEFSGHPDGWHTRDYDEEDFARDPLPRDTERISKEALEPLYGRVGMGIPWFDDFHRALQEARARKRPLLQVKEWGIDIRVGAFSEPSTVDLLRTRFVCYRERGPNQSRGRVVVNEPRLGLSSLVFFSSEGEELWRFGPVAAYHEDLFNEILRRFLKEHADVFPQDPASFPNGESLLAAGLWEELLDRFPSEEGPESLFWRGEALLRLRRYGEAGELLDRSLAASADPAQRAKVLASLIRLHIRLGAWDRVALLGRQLLEEDPEGAFAGEALSRMADGAWMCKREEEALSYWKRIVLEHPESPFAPEAAAALLGKHSLQHNLEEERPLEQWFSCFDPPTAGEPEERARRIAKISVEHLLRWQRSDGRWTDFSFSFGGREDLPKSSYHVAVTALCALALREWRDLAPREIGEALARAERVLGDPGYLAEIHVEKVYAHTYLLLYWLRAARGEDGKSREDALREAQRCVERVVTLQGAGGEWPVIYAATFSSAPVVWALALAREAGLEVPSDAVERGVSALSRVRSDEGSFPYRFSSATHPRGMGQDRLGAVARDPLCELACYVHGRSDPQRLRAAVAFFMEHRGLLERSRRFPGAHDHSNHTIAPYYFYFGHFYVLEALKLLPEEERKRWARELLASMVTYPEIDGSFVDSVFVGKAYGTAMGLLILDDLLTLLR